MKCVCVCVFEVYGQYVFLCYMYLQPRERMSTVASSEVLIPSAQNKSFGDDTK